MPVCGEVREGALCRHVCEEVVLVGSHLWRTETEPSALASVFVIETWPCVWGMCPEEVWWGGSSGWLGAEIA